MYILSVGRALPEQKTGMIGSIELDQAAALAAAGNKVIYTYSDNRSIKVVCSAKPVRTSRSGVEIYGSQFPAKGLPKALQRKIKASGLEKAINTAIAEKGVPDLVHIHFPLLTINRELLTYLRGLGCKIAITEHFTAVQNKTISQEQKDFLRELVESVDCFICVSEGLKKSVCEITKTNKNIHVVPNMVSSEFACKEAPFSEDSTFVFTAIGRLVPVKRFDMIAEAFTKAFRGNKNVRLQIMGGGVMERELKNLVKTLGMSEQIEMTGFLSREKVAENLRNSGCYVSASNLETFCVPFIEGWVTGVPCIGADDNPIYNYFNDSNGLLFKAEDVDSLAEAMKLVYSRRSTYDPHKISEKASELFSAENVSKRLVELFENC